MKHRKRCTKAAELVDRSQYYDIADTVGVIKKTTNAGFDETVELHVRTGADGRHADQQIRGAVVLPHGTNRAIHILVFTKGPKGDEAEAADAGFVGGQELIPKVQDKGWLNFDIVVAASGIMGVIGRFGKALSPKGLMPGPKSGTVAMDLTKVITDIKADKVEYRLDKTNIVHCPVGKASFTKEQLRKNLQALLDALNKAKPSSLKGAYMESVMLTSTVGPGVRLNTTRIAG